MLPTSRYAGWLPPLANHLRDGGNGWFPMKATSVATIFAVVTSNESSMSVRRALVQAMVADPGLVVATAAHVSLSSPTPPACCSLVELADWWVAHANPIWTKTDWLAAPSDSVSAVRMHRFEKLDDYFRNVPLRRWLAESQPFFAAAEFANPIPDAVKQAWFEFDHPLEPFRPGNDAHRIIARAAREQVRAVAQEQSFSDSVRSAKRELAHGLAYGLSHEINNPLANISTRAQTLARCTDDPRTQESLQRIVDQTARAHAMIADLMFYANPPQPRIEPFDLHDRLQRVMQTFSYDALRMGIDLLLVNAERGDAERGDAEKGRNTIVNADAEMFGEAVAVLIRNSLDAIGTDGTIRVECRVEPDEDGSMICVEVSDSGPGLSPEQASRAKDPFYSGREAGRGLGLGLCRSERIASLHGGSLNLVPALAGCVATLQIKDRSTTIG